ILVTGSPGGSTIITTVLQTVVNVIDHEMNIAQATDFPRFHHQWFPDELLIEDGVYLDVDLHRLRRLGYGIRERGRLGATQSILVEDGVITGASDPRGGGIAVGF